MKYFNYFPKIFYPTKVASNGVYEDFHQTSNLMLGVHFREALKTKTVFFYDYIVRDEDRPDIIAHKYYGSPEYTWVIFLANDIIDPIYDWVLPYSDFISYLIRKYGSIENTVETTKHYFNENKYIIDRETWLSLPAEERSEQNVYEWEEELNEEKRKIKLLDSAYLNKVLSEFRDLLKERIA